MEKRETNRPFHKNHTIFNFNLAFTTINNHVFLMFCTLIVPVLFSIINFKCSREWIPFFDHSKYLFACFMFKYE